MTVDTFVPNDTKIFNNGNWSVNLYLSNSWKKILSRSLKWVFPGRINIITGPNYSGKSIYVKQVNFLSSKSYLGLMMICCFSNFCMWFTRYLTIFIAMPWIIHWWVNISLWVWPCFITCCLFDYLTFNIHPQIFNSLKIIFCWIREVSWICLAVFILHL